MRRAMRVRNVGMSVLLSVSLGTGLACKKKSSSENTAKAEASAAPSASAPKAKSNELPAPADVAAPPANAEKTESGLASVVLKPGTGADKPTQWDSVTVHYTGWTKDGKMFDSSVTRSAPTSFRLDRVIKGWTEGLQLMTVGEKRRFWIPGSLAYGDTPRRPGAPAGQLTFDVELLAVQPGPKPPPVPEDVAQAPATAKKTPSGLQYVVLTPGTGKLKPTDKQRVMVHYTGWTPDGKMFDTSVTRGRPATFGVDSVIKGWTEGLKLMVEGEKRRYWIPSKLAYGDKPERPGAPAGALVFEIELVKVLEASKPLPPGLPPGDPRAKGKGATNPKGGVPPNPTRPPPPTPTAPPLPKPTATAPPPKPPTVP